MQSRRARDHFINGSITVQLVSSLTRLDALEQEKSLLNACCKATESKQVKPKTSHAPRP